MSALVVTLRPTCVADLSRLFELHSDDEARVMAAFADTSNDREAYLRRWRRLLDDGEIVNRTVLVDGDGDVAGSVAAFPCDGATEVTYWIDRRYWGRGVATRALAALLEEVAVRPLRARTASDNLGSMRVLERNGFVRDHTERAFAEARNAEITEVVFRLG